jgi:hypothetical protein
VAGVVGRGVFGDLGGEFVFCSGFEIEDSFLFVVGTFADGQVVCHSILFGIAVFRGQ